MASAIKKDPSKWKRIVASVKAGTKGGDPGEWSARKAQLATQKYKSSGGSYVGPRVMTIVYLSGLIRNGVLVMENQAKARSATCQIRRGAH